MAAYSNQGKADLYFMYGLVNGNALEARLYRGAFPEKAHARPINVLAIVSVLA